MGLLRPGPTSPKTVVNTLDMVRQDLETLKQMEATLELLENLAYTIQLKYNIASTGTHLEDIIVDIRDGITRKKDKLVQQWREDE